jgi:hypothetical protein
MIAASVFLGIVLATAAAPAAIADPGFGPFIVPAAMVVVALLGIISALLVRVIRGPVEVRDLWTENRTLRADLEKVDGKVDTLIAEGRKREEAQHKINRTMGDGFDALSNFVEREAIRIGQPPAFTSDERIAVEKARALRGDDISWPTFTPATPEGVTP